MINPEQREARKRYIGSSDAAAICGLDPYRTAADVWLEKTGRVDDFEGNENTERGVFMEPGLLAWAKKKIGFEFETDVMMVAPCGILAANFDGILRPGNEALPAPFVVEAKTTNDAGEWGEEETDQVPERVVIQTHFQMYVGGLIRRAYVPVLKPGYRELSLGMYCVARNDDLADAIAARCREFMEKYVRKDIQPEGIRPSLEILKRMKRQPNKVVPLSDELVDKFITAKAHAAAAADDLEEMKRTVLAAMGDAEGASYSRGELTYLTTHKKSYVVKETTYRSLRIKAAK